MSFPDSAFCIGPHRIFPPLVLAPLHEITDQPFRKMMWELGGLGLTVSEMISVEALIRRAPKARAMMAGSGHRPFSVQLVGCIPAHLAQCAQKCEEQGADMVDLNLGCPASNVTKGGCGSALMRDFRLAEQCLSAMVKAVKIPVTVKMRAGWDASQKERGDYLEFMRMAEQVGVQALCLHPRTRSQQYSGRADWSLIGRAVELGLSYPVIGNGDILQAEDAHRMVQETGCHGVMIGRAALTNPFIFRQIMDPSFVVTPDMRIDATVHFFHHLQALCDERDALHKIKKIGAAFTKGIAGGAKFRQRLNECHDPGLLLEALNALKHPDTNLRSKV